jgi:hypothetical protein
LNPNLIFVSATKCLPTFNLKNAHYFDESFIEKLVFLEDKIIAKTSSF